MVHTKAKALVTALSAILLLLLGLALAQVFWQAYGYWFITNNASTAVITQSKASMALPKPPKYADAIGSAHLFGRSLKTEMVDPVATAAMPESLLNVSIKGILALADEGQSMAILSVENAADEVFKIGAELASGYQLHQIVADGVVVDHLGKLEMIYLPRASMADITNQNLASGASSAAGLGQLRAEVLRNPLALEQHITFVPYSSNGQFAGYRVNQGSKPAMFQKLGLQPDDIVASVDGVGIGQLAGRMDILTNLSVASSLRLGIIRDGKEQQLFVDFSQ